MEGGLGDLYIRVAGGGELEEEGNLASSESGRVEGRGRERRVGDETPPHEATACSRKREASNRDET